MFDISYQKINLIITSTLIYLFPIFILGRENHGALILILLTLLGGFALFKDDINPLRHPKLRLISILFISYFFSIILFIIFSEKLLTDILNYSPSLVFFLFTPLICLAIFKANINIKRLILFIKIGLILISLYTLYNSTNLTLKTDRVLWVSHIGSMLLVFSWVNINHEKKYELFLTLITSILTINAILLAGFRGHILSLFVVSIIFLVLNNVCAINKQRNKLFAVFLLLTTIVLIQFNPNVKNRFIIAIDNLQTSLNIIVFNLESRELIEKNLNTSSGQRIEMYRTGLIAFTEKPFFGNGYLNTTKVASNFTKNEYTKQYILQHNHLHSTYIETLAFGGITGFSIILTLFFLPLMKFYEAFKKRHNTEYAFLGILLIASYILLGITDTMIGGIFEDVFYIFFLSIFLPKVIFD
jgi:O-antigen ligase